MPKLRYTEFYEQILKEGKSQYYFNAPSYDSLGRPVEVMQLRSALTQWAKDKGVKVATRYDKATQTLEAHLLN